VTGLPDGDHDRQFAVASFPTIAFTPPTTGGPVTFYTAIARSGGQTSGPAITTTGPSSPLTLTGLTNGTSYTFTARSPSTPVAAPSPP
jgi:hypothetical protein